MLSANLVHMEALGSTSALRRVTSPEAATWLTAPDAVDLLRPFLGRTATVSEAAAVLGRSVKDTHYRVKRMVDLGILQVVAEEPRAGRPMKRYSTCCERFFVPFALTPAATIAERVLQQTRPALEAIGASIVREFEEAHVASRLGFELRADGGKVTTFLATENGAPDWTVCHHWLAPDTDAMYLFAATYRLERHRAKEVQRRIDELLADLGRYREEAEGSPTARNYRSLLAIAPDA